MSKPKWEATRRITLPDGKVIEPGKTIPKTTIDKLPEWLFEQRVVVDGNEEG